MKMKPGDYILKQDIPDKETHERIREAIRNMGYRTNPGIGEWSKRNYVQHDALAVIGEQALWISSGMCEGRRLSPANILGDDDPQGHPAADLLAEIAKVARTHPEPWREFEVRYSEAEKWAPRRTLSGLIDAIHYGFTARRKPRTITINGHEVPEPVREELTPGKHYYCPDPGIPQKYLICRWTGDNADFYRMHCGLVHLYPQTAEHHADALLSFTKRED